MQMKKLIMRLPKAIVIIFICSCVSYTPVSSESEYATVTIKIEEVYVTIELADTVNKRIRGLQDRMSLESDKGMLFVYEKEQYQNFWMKDTYIPLDLAFINADGRILEIHQMIPHDRTVIRSREKVKYVLEVNEGWFNEYNIYVGAILDDLDSAIKDNKALLKD